MPNKDTSIAAEPATLIMTTLEERQLWTSVLDKTDAPHGITLRDAMDMADQVVMHFQSRCLATRGRDK